MSNKRKLFIYNITISRYYRPLVGVFFLTLPDATANQIGFFVTVAHFTKFFFEIPSGYFGDRFGHKNTLILSQVCMLVAAVCFAMANHLWHFIIASFFMAVGQSLVSGTNEAFFHEMLEDQGKEKEFGVQWAKFKGNVAIISMIFLFVYPWIGGIDLTRPFWISAGLSIVGILASVSLSTPEHVYNIKEQKSIGAILKDQKHSGFYIVAIFFAIIGGLYISESSFREPFIVELGIQIGLIGVMIGLSRLFMRLISKSSFIKRLDALPLKKFMLLDLGIISLGYMLAGINGNEYITMLLFACIIGYWQSRRSVISRHLLATLVNKKYKATLLSIYSQIESIIGGIIVFGLGYLMNWSYGWGFVIIGCGLLVVLLLYYLLFVYKEKL